MKVFHLTKTENLYGENGIISNELIPNCGERSKSVGDNKKAIYFTTKYTTLPVWQLYLYPNVDLNELCVLSFDIAEDRCINNTNKTEFFTIETIPPERINIVKFFDKRTLDEIPFIYLQEDSVKYYDTDFFPTKVEILLEETPINNVINKKSLKKIN